MLAGTRCLLGTPRTRMRTRRPIRGVAYHPHLNGSHSITTCRMVKQSKQIIPCLEARRNRKSYTFTPTRQRCTVKFLLTHMERDHHFLIGRNTKQPVIDYPAALLFESVFKRSKKAIGTFRALIGVHSPQSLSKNYYPKCIPRL